jgi:hypothetical protein
MSAASALSFVAWTPRIRRSSCGISDQSRLGSSPHPGQTISSGPPAVTPCTRSPGRPSASFPGARERGAVVVTGPARTGSGHGTILLWWPARRPATPGDDRRPAYPPWPRQERSVPRTARAAGRAARG